MEFLSSTRASYRQAGGGETAERVVRDTLATTGERFAAETSHMEYKVTKIQCVKNNKL